LGIGFYAEVLNDRNREIKKASTVIE
jgi:hypothetical protein